MTITTVQHCPMNWRSLKITIVKKNQTDESKNKLESRETSVRRKAINELKVSLTAMRLLGSTWLRAFYEPVFMRIFFRVYFTIWLTEGVMQSFTPFTFRAIARLQNKTRQVSTAKGASR